MKGNGHGGSQRADLFRRLPDVVLVPLDGTPEARYALPVARQLAAILKAPLHLLHVARETVSHEELLQRLHLDHAAIHGMIIHQREGAAVETIVDFARHLGHTLLVMTTHIHPPKDGGSPLGEHATQLFRTACCPMVVIRPAIGEQVGHAGKLERILLPYDGTPSTAAADGVAVRLASQAGAELDVVYIAEPGAAPAREPGTMSTPRYVDQPHHEWPAWSREFLERVCCTEEKNIALPRLFLFVASGQRSEEILHIARDRQVGLLVLVWHGHLRPQHALVVKEVVANAPCPVMILRATEPTESA